MRLFAYDAAGGGGPDEGAADAPPAPDAAPQEREDTFFLPPDFPGKDGYKPGDTITLKVVGAGKDGELEVECEKPDEADGDNSQDWKTDLRDNVPTTPG